MIYPESMERICTRCHAQISPSKQADWCPACGSALIDRAPNSSLAASPDSSLNSNPHSHPDSNRPPALGSPANYAPEIDHRGIILPCRHALGGIITPQ